jgi:hypothetical protein
VKVCHVAKAIPLAALLACTTSSVAPPTKSDAAQSHDATQPYDAGDLDGITDDELCQRQCAVTSQVNCPDQATCLSVCMNHFATVPCTEEMRTLIACVLQNGGASILTCDPLEHITVILPGYCTAEQAAIFACLRDAGTGD